MLRPRAGTLPGDASGVPLAPPDPARLGAFARETPARAPGVTTSVAGAAADTASAVAIGDARPLAVGLALPRLDRLATCARHRGTGDRRRMASLRPPIVLELEESSTHGSTARAEGRARPDSDHVAGQSALGCAPDPRRTTEGGRGRLSGHRREVHGPPPAPAVAHLAYVLGESHRTDHGGRLLRGADRDVSPALRLGHHRPPAPPCRARGRHRPSDRRLDRATVARGVSLGGGAEISPEGSRSCLRWLGRRPRSRCASRNS